MTLWYVRVDDEVRNAGERRLLTRDEFIRAYRAQQKMFSTVACVADRLEWCEAAGTIAVMLRPDQMGNVELVDAALREVGFKRDPLAPSGIGNNGSGSDCEG